MPKKISALDIDVAIRKCNEFVLQAYRHISTGTQLHGLRNGSSTRIAAIELRDKLNKIIETEN